MGEVGRTEPHGSLDQEEKFGGYDTKFVDPIPNAFQSISTCPICHLLLRDPYQTDCCDTNFCNSCIQQIKRDSNPCPICRNDNFTMFPNKSLKRALNQSEVLCTHSKDGCEWTGELGDLQHHLNKVDHSGESFLFKWADHPMVVGEAVT